MKIALLASFFSLFVSFQAAAYAEKTYVCRNATEGLPANTYKIQNVTAAPGVTVPYVELVRHFAGADENSAVQQTRIVGFASVSTTTSGNEIMMIGALRLEFDGETLLNCRQ